MGTARAGRGGVAMSEVIPGYRSPLVAASTEYQRLLGERILEVVTSLRVGADEQGFTELFDIQCPHDGPQEDDIMYLNCRLILCRKCRDAVGEVFEQQQALWKRQERPLEARV